LKFFFRRYLLDLVDPKYAILATIFIFSLTLHFVSYLISTQYYTEIRWVHYPAHTFLEISGSIVGMVVAWLVVKTSDLNNEDHSGQIIAIGLTPVAFFDGVHALFHAGQSFVWFHSIAVFIGGLGFSLLLLPFKIRKRIRFKFSFLIVLVIIALVSLMFPYRVPKMVIDSKFSGAAIFLNVTGGLLMLVSSVKLIFIYLDRKNFDDLLFVFHLLFFGLAALMFQGSQLWDISWWGWHFLRFIAYAMAFGFGFQALFQTRAKILAREDIDQLVSKLQGQNEELSQLTYRVSHDLKGPILNISGLTDILSMSLQDRDYNVSDEIVGRLKNSIEKLKDVLDGIIDLLVLGKNQSNTEEINFEKMMERVKDVYSYMLSEGNIKVSWEINLKKPFHAPKIKIEQILENLVSNSIKYYDQDKKDPFVKILVEEYENQLRILVTDNGLGIPVENHAQVFNMFDRFHDKSFGSGLGTYLVKQNIEALDGTIDFESSPEGTLFDVRLPLSKEKI